MHPALRGRSEVVSANGAPRAANGPRQVLVRWEELHFRQRRPKNGEPAYSAEKLERLMTDELAPEFGLNAPWRTIDEDLATLHPREGLSAEGVRGIAKRLGRETPNNNTVNLRRFDKNATGLEDTLTSLGVRVRYNLRANTAEWRRGQSAWQAFTDRSEDNLRQEIEREFFTTDKGRETSLHFSREKWRECLNALLFLREVDPFVEWLDTLPAWDQRPRIKQLLQDFFGAEENELTRWASVYPIVGGIQRTFDPGCQLDESPVLIGDGGIGKSTFLKALVPDAATEWFSDRVSLLAPSKDQVEAMLSAVIVEFAEMIGVKRASNEAIKAFWTRRHDDVRLALLMGTDFRVYPVNRRDGSLS